MHKDYYVVDFMIGFVGLCANSFALAIFFTNKELRKTTNYHIISLTIADIFFAVLSSPTTFLTDGDYKMNRRLCLLMCTSLRFFYGATEMYHLVSISTLRFVRIMNPAENGEDSPNVKRFVRVSLGVSWTVPIVFAILPMMSSMGPSSSSYCSFDVDTDEDWVLFLLYIVILPMIILMTFIYAYIYNYVRKRNSRAEVTYDMLKRGAEEMRGVRFYMILAMFSAICWLPLTIYFGLVVFDAIPSADRANRYVLILLVHANAAGNPFLYAFAYADFRKALRRFYQLRIKGQAEVESRESRALRAASPVQ